MNTKRKDNNERQKKKEEKINAERKITIKR